MSRFGRIAWAIDLGLRSYGEIWSLMEKLVSLRQAGSLPDILLLGEHSPVITMGKSGRAEHVLISSEERVQRGIALHQVNRGGDVTFHGPGQLVAYPILDLTDHGKDVHLYCRKLEELGLKTLSDYGMVGQRVPGLTGVWVGNEKIMAIGVGVKRWVSYHGLAFNVNTDLEYFRLIHPCGLIDREVTSLSCLLKREISLSKFKERLLHHFSHLFGLKIQRRNETEIGEAIHEERQEALLAGTESSPA